MNKYCECCGKLSADILKTLKDGKEIKNHKLSSNGQYFYDGNNLDYCGYCGEKLDEEDIRTANESRGEFWGAPCSECIVIGYNCPHCGEEERY